MEINYTFKSQIINSGLVEKYKKFVYARYSEFCFYEYGTEFNNNLTDYLDIDQYYLKNNPKEWNEARKIYCANVSRTCRLKKRISLLLNKECLFLTFTFTDNVLKTTTPHTRRTYVTRFLKQCNCKFVANIDFGSKKGREHYHAIIQINKIDYSLWKYGALNGKKIVLENHTDTRLAKYVAKLTNHAIKETTKRNAIIYSR